MVIVLILWKAIIIVAIGMLKVLAGISIDAL